MDVHRYISSGILESYVFGSLPEAAQSEVETAVLQYPDIKAAVNSLQLDKERFVKLYAIVPPPGIKERLLDIIQQESTQEGNDLLPEELRMPLTVSHRSERPVKPSPRNPKPVMHPLVETTPPLLKDIPPETAEGSAKNLLWKCITAAIVLLLLGSIILNFFFFQKSTDYKSRYKSLIATKEKLDAEKEHQALASFKDIAPETTIRNNPAFKWVQLKGAGEFAGHTVEVGWNPNTHLVFLLAPSMPVPPAGKQFQLWAVVDQQLVNVGVFETGAAVSQKLQQMKAVDHIQGVVVTLEEKGGSTTPSMDQLYLSVKWPQ
ncbi:anti-sigma factor domain-containing protein [Chitinophaga sp. 30R24]|uniref:anti-sigma factor n=1 Tax=Chitinophaga sp. 30R24 TaxID=3248838 RepID=UPI003B8EC177